MLNKTSIIYTSTHKKNTKFAPPCLLKIFHLCGWASRAVCVFYIYIERHRRRRFSLKQRETNNIVKPIYYMDSLWRSHIIWCRCRKSDQYSCVCVCALHHTCTSTQNTLHTHICEIKVQPQPNPQRPSCPQSITNAKPVIKQYIYIYDWGSVWRWRDALYAD